MEDFQEKIQPVLERAGLQEMASKKLTFTLLHGDASARRYVRIELENSRESWVAMILANQTARFSSQSLQQTGSTELPFANIQRYLKRVGIRVPEIRLVDEPGGVVILEDLGDQTLERVVSQADSTQRLAIYQQAVDLLVDLQARTTRRQDPGCLAFNRVYAFDLLRWELDHFLEHIVVGRNQTLSKAERKPVDRAFDDLASNIASWPRCFVHRDFQSRNIMCKDDCMVLIDFQDALFGPNAYDLVALLRDSYVVLEYEQVDFLIDHYLGGCLGQGLARPEANIFRDQFHRLTLLRKMKDAGRFVFFQRVKGNPSYLPFVPASLRYVSEAFDRLEDLSSCREVLARVVPELDKQPYRREVM